MIYQLKVFLLQFCLIVLDFSVCSATNDIPQPNDPVDADEPQSQDNGNDDELIEDYGIYWDDELEEVSDFEVDEEQIEKCDLKEDGGLDDGSLDGVQDLINEPAVVIVSHGMAHIYPMVIMPNIVFGDGPQIIEIEE